MSKRNKYATIDSDGLDYRSISKELKKDGYTIGHSSVRNDLLNSMKKIAKIISKSRGLNLSDEELFDIAKSPIFQQGVGDVLFKINNGQE